PYHDRTAVHRREIEGMDGRWTVRDVIRGADGRRLQSFLHLHPDFELRSDGTNIRAEAAGAHFLIEPFGADDIVLHRGTESPAQGWYCPEFGLAVPAPVIELVVEHNRGEAFGYSIEAQPS